MRKSLVFLVLLVVLLASATAAFAGVGGSATKHVTLTESSGQFYPGCCGTILFNEYRLTVGADGSYNFSFDNNTMPALTSNRPLALVYGECGFDPLNYVSGMLGLMDGLAGSNINLSAGTYSVAFISNQGTNQNGGNLVTGSYDATVSGPGSVSFSAGCIPVASSGGSAVIAKDADPDGDGVSGDRDNCPMDYNPGQEDGWGSGMGDECDTDWYNMSGIGISAYEQKDGSYNIHGNCFLMADGEVRCPVIASFDPSTLSADAGPLDVSSDAAGTWSVVVHYLHSNNGPAVYQVNIYSTNPPQPDTLVDDRLEIHVNSDGSWQWYQRGGHSDYNGI